MEDNIKIIIDRINSLGGQASLKEIYEIVLENEEIRSKNYDYPESAIRAAITRNSSSTEKYNGKYDIFYPVEGLGKGIWGVRDEYRKKNENIKEIESDYYTETEKEVMGKIRIGQGKFRDSLFNLDSKCRLCGVDIKEHLIASHIKPWIDSDNFEKLDVNNGLLLCPNHDSLFDKGYISFDDNGQILISDELDENNKIFLNIDNNMIINLNIKEREYMSYHRDNIFENWKNKL